MAMFIVTFQHDNNIHPETIMSAEDARRYAAVTDSRIVAIEEIEEIGRVWDDDWYGKEIYHIVYRRPDGRLIKEDNTQLTQWQEKHILSLEEIII